MELTTHIHLDVEPELQFPINLYGVLPRNRDRFIFAIVRGSAVPS